MAKAAGVRSTFVSNLRNFVRPEVCRAYSLVHANLLLSFHVFLTRKHAMFQVRGVVAMAKKHRDSRGKRPRSEVNACP